MKKPLLQFTLIFYVANSFAQKVSNSDIAFKVECICKLADKGDQCKFVLSITNNADTDLTMTKVSYAIPKTSSSTLNRKIALRY